MVDVMILGGAENSEPLQQASGEQYEALINLAGRPMVEYVLEAVKAAENIGKIAIIGPTERLKASLSVAPDVLVECGDSLLDNMRRGVKGLNSNGPVLILSGDIPLITPEAINDFVQKATSRPAEVYYTLVGQDACEKHFPGIERTYVRLKEGMFTGGNLAMIDSDIIINCSEDMAKFFEYRKSAMRLGRLLGANVLLRLALGRLKLEQVEKRVRKTTGYNGVGVITHHAEVAFDVDKPSDLQLAETYLKERRRA